MNCSVNLERGGGGVTLEVGFAGEGMGVRGH